MDLKQKLAGKFIVLDGPDGSGKGTQIRLVTEHLADKGLMVINAHDPGCTNIGDRIRKILLDYDLTEMDIRCETFLFMASRAQLIGEVIDPAIQAGQVVLCDRFISATCAYQGAAGYNIERIIELGRYAVGDTWPNLTLIIDVPVEEGFKRTGRKRHHAGRNRKKHHTGQGLLLDDIQPDAMEARPIDYHRHVRELFLNLPPSYPGLVRLINGMGTIEEVHNRIMEVITRVDF